MGVCWAAVHTVSGARRLILTDSSCLFVRSCLARYGHKHTWMGFIDVDEFLMFRWEPVQTLCTAVGLCRTESAVTRHPCPRCCSGPAGATTNATHKRCPRAALQGPLARGAKPASAAAGV